MSYYFISYSRSDRNFVSSLESLLQEKGIRYFRDEKDIEWGCDVNATISTAIENCTALIVIISPNSLNSPWVAYEVGYAKARQKKVLPLLTEPTVNLPSFLKNLNFKFGLNEVCKYLDHAISSEDLQMPIRMIAHDDSNKETNRSGRTDLEDVRYLDWIVPVIIDGQKFASVIQETLCRKLSIEAASTRIKLTAYEDFSGLDEVESFLEISNNTRFPISSAFFLNMADSIFSDLAYSHKACAWTIATEGWGGMHEYIAESPLKFAMLRKVSTTKAPGWLADALEAIEAVMINFGIGRAMDFRSNAYETLALDILKTGKADSVIDLFNGRDRLSPSDFHLAAHLVKHMRLYIKDKYTSYTQNRSLIEYILSEEGHFGSDIREILHKFHWGSDWYPGIWYQDRWYKDNSGDAGVEKVHEPLHRY